VEIIHGGEFRGYPLDQRRANVSERLALGMTVCLRLTLELPRRSWPEQVLPYGLAEMLLIIPSMRTLTESSREVRLPCTV
jgi:hypothetical protein